jgi:hypothetical protein
MSGVTGQDNVIRMMMAVKDGARPKLVETMRKAAFVMQAYVQDQKLSGQSLRRITGTLRRSIFERTEEDGTSISAATGTNVAYAKSLEYGAAPHVILPVRAKMLSFLVNGKRVFAKQVNHPGNRAYYFLRDTLNETAPANIERIRTSMVTLIAESQA